jgi:hypothetical protein
MGRVFEIVPPLLKAFDNDMQLFVMRMITPFSVSKLLAAVRYWVPVPLSLLAQCICRQLWKDTSICEVARFTNGHER